MKSYVFGLSRHQFLTAEFHLLKGLFLSQVTTHVDYELG